MGDVYRGSSLTLLWMGREDEMTERGVAAMNQMHAFPLPSQKVLLEEGFERFRSRHSLPESSEIPYVNQLFKRNWFTRLWVLQEIVLSSEKRCFWGSHTCHWSKIENARKWLLCVMISKGIGIMLKATNLISVVERIYQCGVRTTLIAENLRDCGHLQCTEPRDMVFGIHSLTRWAQTEAGVAEAWGMNVDYSRSLHSIYRDATRAAIAESGTVEILQYVDGAPLDERSYVREGMPSWIPLWREEDRIDSEYLNLYRNFPRVELDYLSSNLKQEFLSLQGFVIATVDELLPCFHRRSVAFASTQDQSKKFIQQCDAWAAAHPKQGSDLYRTVVAEQWHFHVSAMSEEEIFHAAHEMFLGSNDVQRADVEASMGVYSGVRMKEFLFDRFLFRTSTSRIGTGPRAIQVGDELVGLPGSRYPFALRKRPCPPERSEWRPADGYWLIGGCYIYDIVEENQIGQLFKPRASKFTARKSKARKSRAQREWFYIY